jgi:hypothetical protein
MPPELEGSALEVVVLANQFVIEGHGNSCSICWAGRVLF